ncbi:unnamed protein product [Lactuca saligna]|uniref:Uncharacterized protein n=1 Tax=Lactuca saligna TaxID=75948 RepID=A0AA36EP53_LACSI|nr:unnamed protein product [Lactuca saligna]
MKYGSLVNMVIAYGVMVSPMDEIRIIGQHGSRLWCPWRTYGSLVNMVVASGVMVSPMDEIRVIGQHGSCLWSLVNMVVAYGLHDEIWAIGQHGSCLWCTMDEIKMKLFFLEVEHEGKTILEEASALGHLDSTFVLGMMLMAEGRHRKQEVLDMLNNAYRRAKGT